MVGAMVGLVHLRSYEATVDNLRIQIGSPTVARRLGVFRRPPESIILPAGSLRSAAGSRRGSR